MSDRFGGNVNLTLPKLSDFINDCNKSGNLISIDVVIADVTSASTSNSLIITCDAADNINGLSSFSSSTLAAKFKLVATPSGWLLLSSSSTSGGGVSVFFASGTGASLPSALGTLSDFSTPLYLLLDAGSYIFDTQIHWVNNDTSASEPCGFGVYYSYDDLNPSVDFNTWTGRATINDATQNYIITTSKPSTIASNFNMQSGEVVFTQQALVKVGFADPTGSQSYTVNYRSLRAMKIA